ncbi:hypothetical protein COEREDRAFT_80879 [Coemansia reversa NRRL 1564]|uniref:Uncharacterized protein n=1 Tax=Coemansia reversa (strain ATCC 12441 / NRRL 1564) TaxID=763665 RepID=A0A2G5BCR9_COERN|nr:hypothetical protein COEREDRAFT_80879 [Coemansia reversa NRRL 1564]|eukprot:PIA16803.1 hypothetical protein COEREDRAFT_80879 [Coemansia reversa NRRL 1564]
MASGNSKTASKIAALKRKIKESGSSTQKRSVTKSKTTKKHAVSLADRQQRVKSLTKAFGVDNDGLKISKLSTKHNAGRRDVCRSLDHTIVAAQLGESLRGIGRSKPPTDAQRAQQAREKRESAAVAYENHQRTVDETVDELAQLMSSSA